MKKVLAMTVILMLAAASGLAQNLTGSGTPNMVPKFDSSGTNLINSQVFDSGTALGIGTTTPSFSLDIQNTDTSGAGANLLNLQTPSSNGARIFFSSTGTNGRSYGIGSNFIRGNGEFGIYDYTGGAPRLVINTSGYLGLGTTNPQYLLDIETTDTSGAGANLLNLTTPSVNGAKLMFSSIAPNPNPRTFGIGTNFLLGQGEFAVYDYTANAARLVISSSGNVGINTSTPSDALTVAGGNISVTGGGIKFSDNSVQTTAAVPGVVLISPDNSVTVGGTAAAPTVAVNPAVIQERVTGTCTAGAALTAVNADGTVTCGTIGSGGTLASVPVIVAQTSFTGSYGLGSANSIYTADEDAFYRVSVYMNVPTMGTCSSAPCAGEAITLQWNDGVSTTALATANCNLVTPCGSSVVTPVWVQSGQVITAYGQAYGAGTAPTGGGYNAYVLVEKLKE